MKANVVTMHPQAPQNDHSRHVQIVFEGFAISGETLCFELKLWEENHDGPGQLVLEVWLEVVQEWHPTLRCKRTFPQQMRSSFELIASMWTLGLRTWDVLKTIAKM